MTAPALVAALYASDALARDTAAVTELLSSRKQSQLAATLKASESPREAAAEVSRLLRQPLTADSVVRIALLQNPALRAEMYELGVAEGQLLQAGLLPNPEIELDGRIPTGNEAQALQADVGLEYDFARLMRVPLRRGVAEAEREATRARVAGEVIEAAWRARQALYRLQARQQQLELRQRAFQASQARYAAALELFRAGNLPEVEVAQERASVEAARIALAESESVLLDAREELNLQLGLSGEQTQWEVSSRLEEAPAELELSQALEGQAVAASLELAELRARRQATAQRLRIAESEGVLPHLSGGFHGERDGDHWELGAHVTVGLPVFDRQQGRRAALASELQGLDARMQASAVAVRSRLRALRNRVESAARRARHYQQVLLPARERALAELVRQYNAMQVGVFQLLQAQQAVTETASGYVETLLDYRQARAALEALLAGRAQGIALESMAPASSPGMGAEAVGEPH